MTLVEHKILSRLLLSGFARINHLQTYPETMKLVNLLNRVAYRSPSG